MLKWIMEMIDKVMGTREPKPQPKPEPIKYTAVSSKQMKRMFRR